MSNQNTTTTTTQSPADVSVGRVAILADGRERVITGINGQWVELYNEDKKVRVSEIEDTREQRVYNMANHIKPYRAKYTTTRNATGRKTKICNDELSQIMTTLLPNEAVALAAKLLDRPEVLTKYESLNPGQQRMNSGNLIRNAIKRDELTIQDVRSALGYSN